MIKLSLHQDLYKETDFTVYGQSPRFFDAIYVTCRIDINIQFMANIH